MLLTLLFWGRNRSKDLNRLCKLTQKIHQREMDKTQISRIQIQSLNSSVLLWDIMYVWITRRCYLDHSVGQCQINLLNNLISNMREEGQRILMGVAGWRDQQGHWTQKREQQNGFNLLGGECPIRKPAPGEKHEKKQSLHKYYGWDVEFKWKKTCCEGPRLSGLCRASPEPPFGGGKDSILGNIERGGESGLVLNAGC